MLTLILARYSLSIGSSVEVLSSSFSIEGLIIVRTHDSEPLRCNRPRQTWRFMVLCWTVVCHHWTDITFCDSLMDGPLTTVRFRQEKDFRFVGETLSKLHSFVPDIFPRPPSPLYFLLRPTWSFSTDFSHWVFRRLAFSVLLNASLYYNYFRGPWSCNPTNVSYGFEKLSFTSWFFILSSLSLIIGFIYKPYFVTPWMVESPTPWSWKTGRWRSRRLRNFINKKFVTS